MVMTSDQIAGLSGGFQQMGMQQMQNAAMVGTFAGAGQPGFGENVMGRTANIGSSIGGPLAMGGLALAGMDPISMGFRGAMAGFGAGGGMLGVGAAGLGAAAAVGAPLMAGQYAMGQFMQGMQERQQFNQQMRQSFNFFNPMAQGGRGFSTAQLGTIGGDIRQMAGAQAEGGMVGFEELGRLAQNMGRMGMAQGVRDVKEFTDKFKVMVRSLKEIATSMGTSLEEAQKMMSGMRASGVFGAGQQAQFAGAVRAGSLAGGLATTEVTGMMNVGSQISRMIGGRGRAGAAAGVEAITNIGVAQQGGILSEEDIYNVTGLTGAAGRRAMGTQMLQTSARFLRSGIGRQAVAAMAGEGGTLNEEAVEEFMMGGVGTGRTRQLAHQNLGRIGRADFVRNEGRVRGEIMGRFGGLAPAMVMRGWLEQRGINVDEDSDRAMILMQRRLRVGRDEANMMVRMARELPQLMEQRRETLREAGQFEQVRRARAGRGIEGLKRRLEKARSDVQNSLRSAGDEFMQEGSDMIERFVNELTGQYEQRYHKDIQATFRAGEGIGVTAVRARQDLFGQLSLGGGFRQLVESTRQGIYGGGSRSAPTLEQFKRGTFTQQEGLFGGLYSLMEGGQSMAGRYADAGYGSLIGAESDEDLARRLRGVELTGMAFGRGMQSRGGVEFQLGDQYQAQLRGMASRGQIHGLGQDRLRSFGRALQDMAAANPNDEQLQAAAARFGEAPTTQQAEMMGAMIAGGNIPGQEGTMAAPNIAALYGKGQFRTERERFEAVGDAFYSQAGGFVGAEERRRAGQIGAGIGSFATGGLIGDALIQFGAPGSDLISSVRQGIGGAAAGFIARTFGTEQAAGAASPELLGAAMQREEFQRLGKRLLGGDVGDARAARVDVENQLVALQTKKAQAKTDPSLFTATDQAELDAMQSLQIAADLNDLSTRFPDGIPAEERSKVLGKYNKGDAKFSWNDLVQRAGTAGANLSQEKRERLGETLRQMRKEGTKSFNQMRAPGGLLEHTEKEGLLLKTGELGKRKEDMSPAERAMVAVVGRSRELAGIVGAKATTEDDMEKAKRAQEFGAELSGQLAEMTVAEKRDFLSSLRGKGGAAAARRDISGSIRLHERIAKIDPPKRGEALGGTTRKFAAGIAELMGVDASDKEFFRGTRNAGDDAERILETMGVEPGGDAQKGLEEVLRSRGDPGKTAELLKQLLRDNPEIKDAQEKRREAADKEKNPLLAKVEGHLSEINTSMGALSKLTAESIGSAVAKELPKPAENKGFSFSVGSDLRLKKNIAPIENALDRLAQVDGKQYEWEDGGGKDFGVIAQEVQKLFPHVVSEEGGILRVDYRQFMPLAIEAIKDLKSHNDELEVRLQRIEEMLVP